MASGRPAVRSFGGDGVPAVAGCPNAANPDSQPSATLTYGGGGGMASEGSLRQSTSWATRSTPFCDLNDGLTKAQLSVEWVKVRDVADGTACRSASRWPHGGRRRGACSACTSEHPGSP